MDKSVFKDLTYGLYIVSTQTVSKLSGCVVNTVTQITSDNPIIAVSINKNNYTNAMIKQSGKVGISILSKNIDKEIISKFGFASSKDINKFENLKYDLFNNDHEDTSFSTSMPILIEGVCSYLIGNVINIVDADTHDIFLIRVTKTKKLNDEEPLTYKYYQENMKGRSPKKAPTYIEEKITDSNSNKYKCIICGHIYDDEIENIKFEDLPDDWVCPVCGVGKDKFEKIN